MNTRRVEGQLSCDMPPGRKRVAAGCSVNAPHRIYSRSIPARATTGLSAET
ncbi:MAG: hypothetical protein ACFNTB_00680 [Prevotella denticola]|uniref:hypothetical protein n=1 Tax=Prevotella denticola TaxID=28129 RepID=UPI0028800B7E|nr:hypothetical protein [Prevotella denticola]